MADDLDAVQEPFGLIAAWLDEAAALEPNDANAMALATADREGLPNVRMVLLKGISPEGLVFYTNTQSVKGDELFANAQAALCLHWKSLRRQVRARGAVEPVTEAAADAYFASRARESCIGAWASQQSRPLSSREVLEEAMKARTEEFAGRPVPRPPHWKGYRVVPLEIEFWRSQPFRLHDRLVFRRDSASAAWKTTRLYP